jgi:hypothetical protein
MENSTYYITSGLGNGMFTLRKNDGVNRYGELKSYYVCNLCRDPEEAYQKARQYVISQGFDPDAMDEEWSTPMRVLQDAIPNKELNKWGECNPEHQNQMSYVKAGFMPYGKYYDEKIDTIPIDYFVYMFQSDIEKKQSNIVKENIRQQVLLRKAEFAFYVSEQAIKVAQRQDEEEKRRASATDVPEGKIDIFGKIVGVKFQDNMFGGSCKMIVEAQEGFKIFGTIPSSFLEMVESMFDLKGMSVSFSATIEKSQNDNKFGFFKRPTKSKLLKEGE